MVVIPEAMTSIVVPRFSNSADSTAGKWILGGFFRTVVVLRWVSMLIGDWTLEVEQAMFSGSRLAQLKGPVIPVYPKLEIGTLPCASRGLRNVL